MSGIDDDDDHRCTVRRAGAGDLLDVLAVHARRDRGGEPPDRADDRQQRTWREMSGHEGLSVYPAEVDGEAVGTASAMIMPNVTYECAPTLFIEAVVVAVDHRRRGIATALIRRVLRDARAAGCHKIQLLSHKRHADDGAHALYEALGFVAEAEGFRLYLNPPSGDLPGD